MKPAILLDSRGRRDEAGIGLEGEVEHMAEVDLVSRGTSVQP